MVHISEADLAIARAAVCPNPLRDALREGKVVGSVMARAMSNPAIAQVAKNAGFYGVMVDMEHSVLGLETAAAIFASCLSVGVTPLVRVPANTPDYISRALDGGAMGVIARVSPKPEMRLMSQIPHVNSAQEARDAVRYAKFSPIGERSISGGLPLFRLRSVPIAASMQVANEATLCICMLETARAVDVLDEILAVEGVDMLHVGTNDLADDLGIAGDMSNPLIFEYYARISAAAARASVNGRKVYIGIGGMQGHPQVLSRLINEDKNGLIRYVSTADFPIYAEAMERCGGMVNGLLKQ